MTFASLEGKTAIIGGGGSGIGEASSHTLARLGARVVVADIALENAEQVAHAIGREGGDAIALRYDLHDEESIVELVKSSVQHFGKLDIFHANAADLSPEATHGDIQIREMEAEVWDRVFHANVTGTMLCSKHALPYMIEGGGGSIVNTGSVLALRGGLGQSAYSASKAAIMQLTRSVATQYGKQGIRCNAVLPGLTLSSFVRDRIPEQFIQIYTAEALTPTLAEPQDIANAVAFLASDEARMITGQALEVDGGENIHVSALVRLQTDMGSGEIVDVE